MDLSAVALATGCVGLVLGVLCVARAWRSASFLAAALCVGASFLWFIAHEPRAAVAFCAGAASFVIAVLSPAPVDRA